ncbi:lytic transglycosylase domain-containing protein [Acidiphilium iwatense]|uniref:Lytic transglycosylase domain-containing protein n=1 Tax=Acidiphilium iwatense TaxID=768198 RepID=A0ABS9DSN8_9PROT|nr:lytic transglycosylase domain-containing protein [Acidiphilium iwatense]MCF3945756.1 lytic transglycosylase domain-containing protein [Acidiphilium iwatense]
MIAYLKCMLVASAALGLPPRILPTIQALEGGRVGSVTLDRNGTADLGVMQINSIWLPALAERAHLTVSATREQLIYHPCFNIAAAAVIIRTYVNQSRGNILAAVGDYHSHTQKLNHEYLAAAERTAEALFDGGVK